MPAHTSSRSLRRGADAAVAAVGAAAILAVIVLAVAHIDDRYMVGHVSGAWLALAAAVGEGTWYPPLYEDGYYGGTRFMPLFFTLHGGLAKLSGEPLVSGKALALAANAALVVLLIALLRRRGARWPLVLGLTGAVLASWAASSAVFGVRGDVLAVVLQLAAVALVAERVTRRRAALAGVLAGFALLTKLSALWAPAAIVVWLAYQQRRAVLPFFGAFAATAAGLATLFELLSLGRMHENLVAFSFGGGSGAWYEGVRRFYQLALRDQRSLWPILLLAAATCVVALVRRPSVYELAFVASAGILVVVLRDVGAYENHLLDVSVLACLVVAGSIRQARPWFGVVAAAAAMLAIGLAVRHTLIPDLRALDDAHPTEPLAGRVSFDRCVLSEDPSLPLLAGFRPVVLDAFAVHRFPDSYREEVDELRARIERREFEHIVLLAPATDPVQYGSFDFNREIAAAIERRYRLQSDRAAGAYWVYEPRSPGGSTCRPERLW